MENSDSYPQQPDPAAYLSFPTHGAAFSALAHVGYKGVDRLAGFTPDELIDEAKDLLRDEGIAVMNMSSVIPDTPQAAYQALTIAGFNAAAACLKDENVAMVIMRTRENTPSFLFGVHWADVQAFGKDVADTRARSNPAPAAFVVFRERQVSIPPAMCDVNVSIAARMLAYKITMKDEYFCCSICKTPFISSDKTGETIREMAVNGVGQLFLRECAESLVNETGSAQFSEK